MLRPRTVRSCVLAALTLALVSGACGGADDTAPDTDATTIVRDRWAAYWQARIASENSGQLHGPVFAHVASGKALERQTRRLRNYRQRDLVRVGAPEFRDAEVRLDDASAMVLACFNADAWTATVDGEPWSAAKYGWELTGSVMRQIDGTWFVVDEIATEDVRDMGKTC